jgi:lysophospholipase L1-like esterase
MTYGDSITEGFGSSDNLGYLPHLQPRLPAGSSLVNAAPGGRSSKGAAQIGSTLSAIRPTHVLILYGTNDWNECSWPPCALTENLRAMVQASRAAGATPILGTLPPVNVGFDKRAPADRDAWVSVMNDLIRDLAAQEGIAVAEIHGALTAARDAGTPIFTDHIHPNDAGYRLIAREWAKALGL